MYKLNRIFNNESCGASIMEVLLVMAICAAAMPFVYSQMNQVNQNVSDISTAKKIIALRSSAMNFVRMNENAWGDTVQIKLSDSELATISDMAKIGFVDKYITGNVTITDVYLAFPSDGDVFRNSRIANHIGADAAVVGSDLTAYGNGWAVTAPEFTPGDLIYRISRDFVGEDKSKYLHRGTSGEDDLNVMQRNLNMGGNAMYDIGTTVADMLRATNGNATFVESNLVRAGNVYFSDGANMDGANVVIDNLRVSGDITGFRSITANVLNGTGYTTSGSVVADRATVVQSVNVANNLSIKSSSARSISGLAAVNTGMLATSLLNAGELVFAPGFGLTVSGELLMSTTPPLQFGNWSFPSSTPPVFSQLILSRATVPNMPNTQDFYELMRAGWQSTGGM